MDTGDAISVCSVCIQRPAKVVARKPPTNVSSVADSDRIIRGREEEGREGVDPQLDIF